MDNQTNFLIITKQKAKCNISFSMDSTAIRLERIDNSSQNGALEMANSTTCQRRIYLKQSDDGNNIEEDGGGRLFLFNCDPWLSEVSQCEAVDHYIFSVIYSFVVIALFLYLNYCCFNYQQCLLLVRETVEIEELCVFITYY